MNAVWMESELKGVGIDVGTCCIYAVWVMFNALLFLWQLSSQSSYPSDAEQWVQNSVNSREILWLVDMLELYRGHNSMPDADT